MVDAAAADSTPGSATPSLDPPSPMTRPRVRGREVALVALLASLLYLPGLGSYNLWDPWETHYAEVARRMQQDHDWIKLQWQNENFRSKPVLTFWLMSGGMQAFGVGEDGGFSGEFVSSHKAEWALRLPFALFGIGGLTALWWMLARLYSKRAAWFATVILGSCPYYFFISRQAITDMPSCAMLIGSMAFLAVAVLGDPDTPLPKTRPIRIPGLPAFQLSWLHGFLAAFALVVVPQLAYFTPNLVDNVLPLSPTVKIAGWAVMLPFILGFVGVCVWIWFATKTTRQAYLYFFYLLNGLAVLAKGPVAPALAGMTILAYLFLTWDWHLLKRVELVRGIMIALAVCLPWHFAIYLKFGNPWLHEYINEHLINRAVKGVFQTKDMPGTFAYFFNQLGIGMWPWVALIPGALASFAYAGRAQTREDKLRLFFGCWAITGFFFFSVIQTKFHHYILPAVPALAVLVAFWFDDLLDGKVRWAVIPIGVAVAILTLASLDLIPHQEKLVQLFCFRYDRPWPKMSPWSIDYQPVLTALALVFGAVLLLLAAPQIRRWVVYGMGVVALVWTIFAIDVLLPSVSPHWGQRTLHAVYYKERKIHGADLTYTSLREFKRDWQNEQQDLEVRSFIPDTLQIGDGMTVTYQAGGDRGEVGGRVSKIDKGGHRFWIQVDPIERQRMAGTLAKAMNSKDAPGRRYLAVNADRLIAWQLNWRGENFYSGGEIYQHRDEDARTVFMDTDNKAFLEYLKAPKRNGHGRKFWVVTEKARLANLKSVLPTPHGKKTVVEEDNSSNKFALGSFTMDEGPPPAPGHSLFPEQDSAPTPSVPKDKQNSEPGVEPAPGP